MRKNKANLGMIPGNPSPYKVTAIDEHIVFRQRYSQERISIPLETVFTLAKGVPFVHGERQLHAKLLPTGLLIDNRTIPFRDIVDMLNGQTLICQPNHGQ